jgi:hypothetical protein
MNSQFTVTPGEQFSKCGAKETLHCSVVSLDKQGQQKERLAYHFSERIHGCGKPKRLTHDAVGVHKYQHLKTNAVFSSVYRGSLMKHKKLVRFIFP